MHPLPLLCCPMYWSTCLTLSSLYNCCLTPGWHRKPIIIATTAPPPSWALPTGNASTLLYSCHSPVCTPQSSASVFLTHTLISSSHNVWHRTLGMAFRLYRHDYRSHSLLCTFSNPQAVIFLTLVSHSHTLCRSIRMALRSRRRRQCHGSPRSTISCMFLLLLAFLLWRWC